MTSRRELLRMLGAGGVASATMSPKDLMALPEAEPGVPQVGMGGSVYPHVPSPWEQKVNHRRWALQNAMRRRSEAKVAASTGQLPPHIGGKRSWSPAFKAHVLEAEVAELEDALQRLEWADIDVLAKLFGID